MMPYEQEDVQGNGDGKPSGCRGDDVLVKSNVQENEHPLNKEDNNEIDALKTDTSMDEGASNTSINNENNKPKATQGCRFAR